MSGGCSTEVLPYHPWDILMVNEGKYTSPMDSMRYINVFVIYSPETDMFPKKIVVGRILSF